MMPQIMIINEDMIWKIELLIGGIWKIPDLKYFWIYVWKKLHEYVLLKVAISMIQGAFSSSKKEDEKK